MVRMERIVPMDLEPRMCCCQKECLPLKDIHSTQHATKSNSVTFYTRRSSELEEGEIAILGSCSEPQKIDTPSDANDLSQPEKEEERRQKMRERKRIQRLNQDFAERERLRARGRIKALREDPVFRQSERQKDKERRRKSRLQNQNQRVQERERDKLHKSLIRSFIGDLNGNDRADSDSMANHESVADSNNWGETGNSDANV